MNCNNEQKGYFIGKQREKKAMDCQLTITFLEVEEEEEEVCLYVDKKNQAHTYYYCLDLPQVAYISLNNIRVCVCVCVIYLFLFNVFL